MRRPDCYNKRGGCLCQGLSIECLNKGASSIQDTVYPTYSVPHLDSLERSRAAGQLWLNPVRNR